MNTKTRLIAGGVLLALVVGLILVIVFVDFDNEEEEATPEPDATEPLFPDSEFSGVNALTVIDNNTGDIFSAVQIEKEFPPVEEGGDPVVALTWEVQEATIESETGIIDEIAIGSATFQLPSMVPVRVLTEFESRTVYGLGADAHYAISFSTTDGSTYQLNVGDQNVGSTAYYVDIEGDPNVYLISSFNLDPLIGFLSAPPYMDAFIEELE